MLLLLTLTKKDHEIFKNFTKCWICKNAYEEGEVKVKHQDHITGKHRGSAHQECKLKLSLWKISRIHASRMQSKS